MERDDDYLKEWLRDTDEAIARVDERIAKYPQYPSLAAARRSLEKRRRVLESRLAACRDAAPVDEK